MRIVHDGETYILAPNLIFRQTFKKTKLYYKDTKTPLATTNWYGTNSGTFDNCPSIPKQYRGRNFVLKDDQVYIGTPCTKKIDHSAKALERRIRKAANELRNRNEKFCKTILDQAADFFIQATLANPK